MISININNIAKAITSIDTEVNKLSLLCLLLDKKEDLNDLISTLTNEVERLKQDLNTNNEILIDNDIYQINNLNELIINELSKYYKAVTFNIIDSLNSIDFNNIYTKYQQLFTKFNSSSEIYQYILTKDYNYFVYLLTNITRKAKEINHPIFFELEKYNNHTSFSINELITIYKLVTRLSNYYNNQDSEINEYYASFITYFFIMVMYNV